MKTPYLIQRAEILRPLKPTSTRVSEAVDLDYMGSSEFEFGATARSLRAMQAAPELHRHLIPDILDGDRQLRVVSIYDDQEMLKYIEHLKAMREDRIHLKETSRFAANYTQGRYLRADFWWDIENHVMWSFDKMFMNRLCDHLRASWAYMDEQKALRDARSN